MDLFSNCPATAESRVYRQVKIENRVTGELPSGNVVLKAIPRTIVLVRFFDPALLTYIPSLTNWHLLC
jgi:hypothetical protein